VWHKNIIKQHKAIDWRSGIKENMGIGNEKHIQPNISHSSCGRLPTIHTWHEHNKYIDPLPQPNEQCRKTWVFETIKKPKKNTKHAQTNMKMNWKQKQGTHHSNQYIKMTTKDCDDHEPVMRLRVYRWQR